MRPAIYDLYPLVLEEESLLTLTRKTKIVVIDLVSDSSLRSSDRYLHPGREASENLDYVLKIHCRLVLVVEEMFRFFCRGVRILA